MPENWFPLVSVVIPVFNSEKFIAETVESVLKQTYQHWELILVDDGSSDGSKTIALQYAKRFPEKIIYAEHEGNVNKGVSATRNLGISKAKGRYVSFLDSDDLWTTDKLEEQVAFLEKNEEIEVLSEATLYWNSWIDPSCKDEIIKLGVPAEKKYYPPELAWKMYPLGPGRAPCMCGIMIKMTALRKIGGFESSFVGKDQLYEDQAFAIKLYLHTIIYVSSKANNIYRQRPDSLMHGLIQEGLYRQGRYFFLRWLRRYLIENRIRNYKVNFKLWTALLRYRYPAAHSFLSRCSWKIKQLKFTGKKLVNE